MLNIHECVRKIDTLFLTDGLLSNNKHTFLKSWSFFVMYRRNYVLSRYMSLFNFFKGVLFAKED